MLGRMGDSHKLVVMDVCECLNSLPYDQLVAPLLQSHAEVTPSFGSFHCAPHFLRSASSLHV